jgi:hypothetical protein
MGAFKDFAAKPRFVVVWVDSLLVITEDAWQQTEITKGPVQRMITFRGGTLV